MEDSSTQDLFTTEEATPIPVEYGENSWNGENCKLYLFLTYIILVCVLCFFGLVGNTLSLTVLWRDRKTSATSFLLICLAVSDSFVLISWTAVFTPYAGRYLYSKVYYKASYFLSVLEPICTIAHTLTTWFTITVTWHRFIAVCRPHQKLRYASCRVAHIQALIIVLAATIMNIPRFFEYKVVKGQFGLPMIVPTSLYNSNLYQKLYKITMYYLVIYILPLILLIFMTYKLIRELNLARKRQEEMTSSGKKEDLTRSLVTVVIVFIICQLFNPIRRITTYVVSGKSSSYMMCSSLFVNMNLWTIVVTNINCSCNFIIYMLVGKRFRHRLYTMLLGFRNRSVQPVGHEMGEHNVHVQAPTGFRPTTSGAFNSFNTRGTGTQM